MSPVAGSEIPIDKVAESVSTLPAADFERPSASLNVADTLLQRVPGITITDVQGGPYQPEVEFHGFAATSVNGTPQGLAVYQNGVRINELFGDTVNWDFIATHAINNLAVITNNPAFGLNAIGGAISITMKDGFSYHGFESDTRGGSFGRVQEALQYGVTSGPVGAYIALEGIHDDGWRNYSTATIQRMYADLGFKGDGSEFHVNFTGAHNNINSFGPTPLEELQTAGYDSVFTRPQNALNELSMVSANGSIAVTNTLSLQAIAYDRRYTQHVLNGNTSDAGDCTGAPAPGYPGPGFLCLDGGNGDPLTDTQGNFIPTPPGIVGSLDRTSVDAEGMGGSLQAASSEKIWGHNNHFIVGGSYDHGDLVTTSSSEIGFIDSTLNTIGLGQIVQQANGEIAPVDLAVTTNYYGLYFSDTFDVTPDFAVTAGGRYNVAVQSLQDLTGLAPDLTGNHTYRRFNPLAGATYKVFPNLTVYAGYSEANRAPTPVELGCSDQNKPCLLDLFVVSDPSLRQVVARTREVGVRGTIKNSDDGKLDWSIGLYHTLNQNDIINVASVITGRGFFQNAGSTVRQGIDASLNYKSSKYSFYINYAFLDATFQSQILLQSPNNPNADANGNIQVEPGDRIPSLPQHKVTAGFDYYLAPEWGIGADAIVASSQYLRGDENNTFAKLAGYGVVNMHTTYQLTKYAQLYGVFENILDNKYYTFGTFFDPTQIGLPDSTDHRSFSPGQPFAAYGGLKVRF